MQESLDGQEPIGIQDRTAGIDHREHSGKQLGGRSNRIRFSGHSAHGRRECAMGLCAGHNFHLNILRHTASAVNISGLDSGDPQKLVRGKRILIQNNLFDDVNGKAWGGGGGVLFQVASGADAVTIDHNTGFQSGQIILADGIPNTNFVYQNNITPHNMYGVMGSGYASGISSLDHFFPGFVFQNNLIEGIAPSGVSQSKYPASTLFSRIGQPYNL